MASSIVTDASAGSVLRALDDFFQDSNAYWTALRGGVVYSEPDMVRYVSDDRVAFASGVIRTRLSDATAGARIGQTIAFFDGRGLPWTWWIEPSTRPEDLTARLESCGFRAAFRIPRLAARLDDVERSGSGPGGLELLRVDGAAAERGWLDAMAAGFDQDEGHRMALRRMSGAAGTDPEGPWVRIVGLEDGAPVASSGAVFFAGLAGVINVSTAPRARRRGIGRAMTLAALDVARERGYRVAVLGTSDMARGIYERLGFVAVGSTDGYVRSDPPG